VTRRALVQAVADVVVAAAVGFLVVSLFGVAGQEDSRPPVCTNRFGNTVDCGQDGWATVIAWVAFGVVLLALWTFHARRARVA
jgi:hypothetical protein